MSEKTNANEDLWKFKRYLHTGFETLEKLKTGDDLKDLKSLISLIKANHGLDAVETIRKISTEGNLNDRTYLIISLAVTARQNFDLKTKTRAYEILKDVCVQPYHLFMFLSKCELFGFLLLHNGELQSQESFKKIDLERKSEQIRIGSAKNVKAHRVPSAKITSHSSVTAHNTDQTILVNSSIHKSVQLARVSSAKKEDKSENSKNQNEISSKTIQNNIEHSSNNTNSNEQVVRILSGKKEENKLSIDPKVPGNERISSAHKNDQTTRKLSGKMVDRIQSANKKNTNETSKNELSLPLIPLNAPNTNNKLKENKIEQEIKLPSIVNSQKSNLEHNRPGFLSPTNPQIVSLTKPCLNTGWGRAHKKAINKWYESLKPLEFAFFLTKYPKKFKWRHRDVFRLSHFKSNNVIHNLLIIYANQGFQASMVFYEHTKDSDKCEHIIKNKKSKKEMKIIYDINPEVRQSLTTTFEYLKAFEDIRFIKDVNELIEVVKKFNFDIEQVFSHNKLALNSNGARSELWIFYLKNNKASLAQILRNLTDFGKRGIIHGVLEDLLCQKIKDQTLIEKENFHPLFLFTLFKIFTRGGNSIRKYAVSSNVSASLYEMFLSSFKSIEILDKPLAICLNTWILSKASLYKNTLVTPFQASVIMLLCSLNSQPNAKLYSLTDKMEEIFIDKNMDFNAVVNKLWQSSIGSTNFSLPILSASEKNLNFDSLVIYTNLEPDIKQTQTTLKALENYRSKIKNPKARFLYVSMAATSGQIADPDDENMLDLIGFTQNSPQIILNFLKGLF